jgi:hypothetical protein
MINRKKAVHIPRSNEGGRGGSEAQPDAVSELVGRKLGAVESIGHGREPCPGLLGAEHPAGIDRHGLV